MNTQLAFAFGMLTMIAITLIVVIVLGMVKVMKITKQVQYIQSEFDRTITHIYHRIEEESTGVRRLVDTIHRRIDEYADITRRECIAYTDSRIDKSLGTTKKQILKD